MTRSISLFQNTHFFHEGIIKFCNRPFESVEEMNETLIRNWNETVPKDGTVFHLGDFAFGGWREWMSAYNRLNGKIHLILGNHDLKNAKQGFDALGIGLAHFLDRPVIIELVGKITAKQQKLV